jgi:hypothetical protein
LTQKALEYRQIIGQFRRLLTGCLQEGTRVFVAMLTHDVGHRTQAFLGWGASIMASATPFYFCTTQKHLLAKRVIISMVYAMIFPIPL